MEALAIGDFRVDWVGRCDKLSIGRWVSSLLQSTDAADATSRSLVTRNNVLPAKARLS
jgi:hypothetical protein